MKAQTIASRELLAQLPADSTLILRNVPWDEYESVLKDVGETRGLRISYDQGTLQIMTLSSEHEFYSDLLKTLVGLLSVKLRITVLFFGSNTIKREDRSRGLEPDACFYVQTASALGHKIRLDFTKDPPPDVAVEIDVHHESLSKFPLYAALGIPEIWRYDGTALTIHRREGDQYVLAPASTALPVLDAQTLTRFLGLAGEKNQHEILLAFEEWLESLCQ